MAPKTLFFLVLLTAQTIAFPFLAPSNLQPRSATDPPKLEPRQSSVGNYTRLQLANLVNGILNGTLPGATLPPVILAGVPVPIIITAPPVVAVGRKAIPDSQHPFRPPGPGDRRGGCPGLNNLANYGYIDRSGVTTAAELLFAQQEVFGFAPDLAATLIAIALAGGPMDPTSLKMSIGDTDTRTNGPFSGVVGQAPGLFANRSHAKFEVDGSIAYQDNYLTPDCFGGRFDSDHWASAVATAHNGQFDHIFVGDIRYKRYQECIATNPNCIWGPKQVFFYAGDTFAYNAAPPSDPSGKPVAPTLDLMSRFWGAERLANGTYVHVPEQLPPFTDGKYWRRFPPLTVPELAVALVDVYLQHPVLFGANSGKVNRFVPIPNQVPSALNAGILCSVFNLLQEELPSELNVVKDGVIALTNILLAPAREALRCPGS